MAKVIHGSPTRPVRGIPSDICPTPFTTDEPIPIVERPGNTPRQIAKIEKNLAAGKKERA